MSAVVYAMTFMPTMVMGFVLAVVVHLMIVVFMGFMLMLAMVMMLVFIMIMLFMLRMGVRTHFCLRYCYFSGYPCGYIT